MLKDQKGLEDEDTQEAIANTIVVNINAIFFICFGFYFPYSFRFSVTP